MQELPLWDMQVEISCLGYQLAEKFQSDSLIPGVLLVERGKFVGMISRRRFLEYISLPHGIEEFSHRSLKHFCQVFPSDILILPGETLIVTAARQSLERDRELLHEPIVVKIGCHKYSIVDVYQLLVAQSLIHELRAKLLQEQSQDKLFQIEKLASLGRMVAGVVHEIKNPFNCISGNLPFLSNYLKELMDLVLAYEAEYPDTSKIQQIKNRIDFDFIVKDLNQVLASINVSAEKLKQIIVSLHNFSPRLENKCKPADIHECIDSTLLILNSKIKQGIEVVKNYGDLPLVDCYSGQMSQVFMNLLSNAIDALFEKSATFKNWQPRIEITTKVVEAENLESVVITIADNGVGMSPEIQKQIFETFFTTKSVDKGTGLGLAISHEIVTQNHGGQLRVTSQPGIGTQFEILLPLVSS
ncbi:MAG: sensor histidine kinase [Heteroscytonema crispum UTEX LB 1556]